MRHTLKSGIRCLIAAVLALPLALAAQNAPKPVTGAGCVEAGVEAGCLVLKDGKTGALYNLFFKGKKASAGMAIDFSGTIHEGPTTCMQGTAVDVKQWKQLKMHCPAPPKKPEPK